MVDFRFLLFCKHSGIDIVHHTDCMDNVDGKCSGRRVMCDDCKDCPVKQKRKEMARQFYQETNNNTSNKL